MDLAFTPAQEDFRREVRDWLANHNPDPAPVDEDGRFAHRIAWQRTLYEAGWAGLDWREEFGGRGATPTETAIFYEELAAAGLPMPANGVALMLVAPTLMVWGTPEQKARFLDPIRSGEEIWCQGFSEPGSGSDLASVSTRAVRDGNEWVVNGQKIWTSFARWSKWCALVVRTDLDAPRHKGLSFLILDMEADGVDVRPIKQMTGDSEYHEVFLDNVRIPADRIVGAPGQGWMVALTMLMNERAGLGFALQATQRRQLDALFDAAIASGAVKDTRVADRLGDLQIRVETLKFVAWRTLTAVESGGQPGPEGSIGKWLWSETAQLLSDFALELLGPQALTLGNEWSFEFLRGPGYTIEGGTTEVQKNIIAEHVLGLPKAR